MKKIGPYILLHLIILFNSFGGVCSKKASFSESFSFEFVCFYGLSLFILAVYALLWQQIIKYIPLNTAYAAKATALVWGMAWGAVFFKEQITLANIIGAVVVLAGVVLMVTGGEKKDE